MNNFFLKFNYLLLIFGLIFSCNKSTNFTNKVYISETVGNREIPLILDGGIGSVDLSVVSAYLADQDLNVNIKMLDDDYLTLYNLEKGTNYVLPPMEAIDFSDSEFSIEKGKASSEKPLSINVEEWSEFTDGVQYAFPIKITPVGNAQVLPGNDIFIVTISKIIVSYAAQNSSFLSNTTIFKAANEGDPLPEVTIEGKFDLTKSLIVPGNWRTDIFVGYGFQLCVLTGGGIDIRFPNAAFMFSENPPVKIPLNKWTHFAITYSGGLVSLYIDGSFIGSSNYDGLVVDKPEIAGYSSNTGCTVSEFRIWDYIRSTKQIRSFMCAVDPASEGLLTYWRFNEGHGKEIQDYSGNGNDLVASGSINWVGDVRCP